LRLHGYLSLPNEVCPAENITVDEYVKTFVPDGVKERTLRKIRKQKAGGLRPLPSHRLTGDVDNPKINIRRTVVDEVAGLVDENLFGRSEMCLQFAALLARALSQMGIQAQAKVGQARYRQSNGEWFTWRHAWVEYDDCIVDGNVDSMLENPVVPGGLDPAPYWGKRDEMPNDREFDFGGAESWGGDGDVDTWWPRLRERLNQNN